MAVKIIEHSAETSSGLKELRESVLSSSIIHPNVVSTYKIRTIPAACPKSCQAYPEVALPSHASPSARVGCKDYRVLVKRSLRSSLMERVREVSCK